MTATPQIIRTAKVSYEISVKALEIFRNDYPQTVEVTEISNYTDHSDGYCEPNSDLIERRFNRARAAALLLNAEA